MTKREALLKQISTYQFAALDLQMYLDTHPNDRATLEKAEMFRAKAKPLIEKYEAAYGPLTKAANDGNNWAWIKGPWPWESEENS
ncbi:MAG: spore coat protein CotJB [Ruminococcus sp.]